MPVQLTNASRPQNRGTFLSTDGNSINFDHLNFNGFFTRPSIANIHDSSEESGGLSPIIFTTCNDDMIFSVPFLVFSRQIYYTTVLESKRICHGHYSIVGWVISMKKALNCGVFKAEVRLMENLCT